MTPLEVIRAWNLPYLVGSAIEHLSQFHSDPIKHLEGAIVNLQAELHHLYIVRENTPDDLGAGRRPTIAHPASRTSYSGTTMSGMLDGGKIEQAD